jgi:hypothetical protein
MRKNTQVLAALSLLSASCACLLRSRAAKCQSETAAMVGTLNQAAVTDADVVSFRDFEALPAPVAAYFRFALKEGQPLIRTAKIRHEGQFCLNDKWIPFASTQHFSAHPPGFVWDAKMKINPLINVDVRDSYLGGRGTMSAKVLSLISVMDAHDDTGLDAGSLLRYLAEAVWIPTALLPSENLRWTPIDNHKALATLSDGNTTVSLEFTFNERGEISSFFAPARIHSLKGESKEFPWAGRLWNYQEKNGLMIPLEGEVEWQMPERNMPYYKGKILDVQYD